MRGCVECGNDGGCDWSDEHELRRCDGCGWPVCASCGPKHVKNEDGDVDYDDDEV